MRDSLCLCWDASVGAQPPSVALEPGLPMPRKFFCTFPQELIQEPIISHTLGEKFGVVPNIRMASITDAMALVAVEIEGEAQQIEASVAYLKDRGVKVEEIVEADDKRPS